MPGLADLGAVELRRGYLARDFSPVEALEATPRADGVRVTWKLPPGDCDGVVLVRTAVKGA